MVALATFWGCRNIFTILAYQIPKMRVQTKLNL